LLREAAVNAAQQWKFEEGAAQERLATLKFSFVILPPSSKVRGKRRAGKTRGPFPRLQRFCRMFRLGSLARKRRAAQDDNSL
jgi:hypothetical protein